MIRQALFAAFAVAITWAPALAAHAGDLQTGESLAVLITPAPKPVDGVVDGRIWHCQDVTCSALPNENAFSQHIESECHTIAKWVGQFKSYQTGRKVMTDAQLTTCNAGVTTKEAHLPS